MLYLAPDTCTWLNLGTLSQYSFIVDRIEELVAQRMLTLLAIEQVRTEFGRNKEKAIEKAAKESLHHIREVKARAQILADEEQRRLTDSLSRLAAEIDRDKPRAAIRLNKLERLLNHPNTKMLNPSANVKQLVCDLAVQKKRPFHGHGNHAPDALILLSFHEFAPTAPDGNDYVFVTNNFNEFSDADNRQPHPDFGDIFRAPRQYSIDLVSLIQELSPEPLPEEARDDEWPPIQHTYHSLYISDHCADGGSHEFGNDRDGRWFMSQYGGGLSWHLVCSKCHKMMDTGEYFD